MCQVELLTHDDWDQLRHIRLTALNDSPHAFLSTYARELSYGEQEWRTEFARGEWSLAVKPSGPHQGTSATAGRSDAERGAQATQPALNNTGHCAECRWPRPVHRRAQPALSTAAAIDGGRAPAVGWSPISAVQNDDGYQARQDRDREQGRCHGCRDL